MTANRFGSEEERAVLEVLREGNLSSFYRSFLGGKKVQELERLFADFHGVKYAISVSSGTAALHCAYLAIGLKPGDEVITTPYSFVSTASMIVVCGAKPVFVDIDPRTYNIHPRLVEGAITDRTTTIVPVHLLGHPADMNPIMELAEKHDLWVVEDACQALGAKYRGRRVGTMGHASVFSGQFTKTATFGGEGGMILTNDDVLAERCRNYRNHSEKYANPKTNYIGFNYRLTELQAAIGVEQFKKLDTFIETQRRNAKYLVKHLPPGIRLPYVSKDVFHPLWILGCQYDEGKAKLMRDEFVEAVTKRGLNRGELGRTISRGYAEVLYQLPALAPYRRKCPVAEILLRTNLWIDCQRYPSSLEDMRKLIEGFEEILK